MSQISLGPALQRSQTIQPPMIAPNAYYAHAPQVAPSDEHIRMLQQQVEALEMSTRKAKEDELREQIKQLEAKSANYGASANTS